MPSSPLMKPKFFDGEYHFTVPYIFWRSDDVSVDQCTDELLNKQATTHARVSVVSRDQLAQCKEICDVFIGPLS